MDSIRNWFNGSQHYGIGVALYQVHGKDSALKEALKQGESPYRRRRLTEALKLILDATLTAESIPTSAAKAQETKPAVPTTPTKSADTHSHTQPEHDKDPYYTKWNPLFKEKQHLRSRLDMVETDEERGAMAFRVLELEREIKNYWDLRDYFLKNGVHKPEVTGQPEQVTDHNALTGRLMTVRTYISKAKGKLKKNPNDFKATTRLKEYQDELELLESKLKG